MGAVGCNRDFVFWHQAGRALNSVAATTKRRPPDDASSMPAGELVEFSEDRTEDFLAHPADPIAQTPAVDGPQLKHQSH